MVLQRSLSRLVLGNINDTKDGIETTVIKCGEDTKQEEIASILEDKIRIKYYLDKLDKWSKINMMKFNRQR